MDNIKVGELVYRKADKYTPLWKSFCNGQGVDLGDFVTVTAEEEGGQYIIINGEVERVWRRVDFEPVATPKDDTVRNPSRYELFPGIESIQVIARSFTVAEFRGFCLGNTLKYRLRAGKKDNVEQELDKAEFYKELFERHKGECRAD